MLFKLLFAFSLLNDKLALAFSFKTHAYLGNQISKIIQDNEDSYLKSSVSEYIPLELLGNASTWADKIKNKPNYRWSKQMHYMDVNYCETKESIPSVQCDKPCIYTAILNMTNEIKYNTEYHSRMETSEQLKFLIHFIQDLHQPLHVFGKDRGGNSWRINMQKNGRIYKTNMHKLWDTYLPEYFIEIEEIRGYSPKYVEIYNILHYEEYLKKQILMMLDLSCEVTRGISENIDFEQYYNHNIERLRFLFKEYNHFMINTLRFIF